MDAADWVVLALIACIGAGALVINWMTAPKK